MKLIFKGIVQGIGFRPTVYRVATNLKLKGYVLNKGSEVEVVVDRDEERFLEILKKEMPSIGKITSVEKIPDDRTFTKFQILHSKTGEKQSQIPPDICTCDACLHEMMDPQDRRYQFPFTNCTVCGARYSLITDVPYDRERTSMSSFPLCEECTYEYLDVRNRRYHAQTTSCPACGPSFHLYDTKKKDLGSEQAIERFAKLLDKGSIGVMKSWGGMHLCCTLDELERFRKWYHRPQKAFAIMVKDLKAAEQYAELTKEERLLLLSNKRPIVLVRKKDAELVSPGLDTIGVYLPYTAMHHLLFSFLSNDALVMTSANIPGEPMLIRNEDAFALKADYYLLHNREIPNRIDDSVIRVWKGHRLFLRKSRGFVPEALPVSYEKKIVSVGAGENICGALSVDKKLFSTQYIGNSKYYGVTEFLESSLRHLMTLLLDKPTYDAVTRDLHPGYESRIVAQTFADECSVPIIDVQHHWAHAASLLVDRGLERSIVLTLDGLGYGEDGQFWGGEVLDASFESYKRVGHLEYLPLLGGDQATKDPRRLVYALFKKFDKEKFFTGEEAAVLEKMLKKSPTSSSLGRYLDALSCYLGICTTRTYSGEPAMKLEKYLTMGKPRYSFKMKTKDNVVNVADLFQQIDEKVQPPLLEKETADLVYSAVKTMVDALTDIAIQHAEAEQVKTIGLSGGVSYNIPLTEMVEQKVLQAGLQLIVHNSVPNGDGGIAVGQNAIAGHQLKN